MQLNLSVNQRTVLDLVRRYQPISRVELASLSGLTSGALVRLSRELLLRDLLEIGEIVAGGRGQPRQPLLINPKGAFSVGAAFYPKQLDIALTDFTGKAIAQESHHFEDLEPSATAKIVWAHTKRIVRAKRLRLEKCLGMGLAVPGYLKGQSASLRTVEELGTWRGVDLSAVFEAESGLNTWTENIASAGAMTELYRPTKSDPRHIVFIHVGYGVGAGIIIAGELHRGRNGNAGEIGAFFPGDEARPSGLDFLHTANALGKTHATLADMEFSELSKEPKILDWIDRASDQIATLGRMAKHWIAPDEFVIGGPFPSSFVEQLADTLRRKINTPDEDSVPMNVRGSEAGPRATAIGAALLPIHNNCSPSPSLGVGTAGSRTTSA